MSLKCPFCRKEYYYDQKICQECENKSILSINIPKDYTYIHYERTSAFRSRKPDGSYVKIDSEPKFSDFKSKLDYNWNCNPRYRFHDLVVLKSELAQLRTIEKLKTTDSKILEKEKIIV